MAWFTWQQAVQLDPSLHSLESFFTPLPVQIQTLSGGLTNRCWRLEDESGRAFVWRPTSNVCHAFNISRRNEYQVLKAISAYHLAPNAALVNDQGLLVEWVDGEILNNDISVDNLVNFARRIHLVQPGTFPLTPFGYTARVDHYWMQLRQKYSESRYYRHYQIWRSAPSIAPVELCLCHFDLAGYNLVRTATGIKAIDWEYATLADPRLDIALLILANDFPWLETVSRYCQLGAIADVDSWVNGVKAWLPRSYMMAMLWCLLAHKLWGDDIYLNMADNYADILNQH